MAVAGGDRVRPVVSSALPAAKRKRSAWVAADVSKRWGEAFFLLLYTPLWLGLVVAPSEFYQRFTKSEYLAIGLVSTVPAFLVPLFLVGKADSIRSLKDRYWVKANVWIIIFSYVGNYFLTHYFFIVHGVPYTSSSWRMNNVPHATFLLTHACFLFYHMMSNMTLRRLRHSTATLPVSLQWFFEAAWILALAYFIAYLETLTIANFPHYEFIDRDIMYTVGSFLISFPMFSRIDEKAEIKWSLSRVAVDALGATTLVTIILDLWRILISGSNSAHA